MTKTNTAGGRVAYVLLLALVLVLGVLAAPTGAAAQATMRVWPASYGLSATGQLGAAPAVALRVGASPRLAAATASAGGSRQDPETVFWQSVADSTNPAELEAYLARWPDGVYAPLARIRLEALRDPPPVRGPVGDVFRDCPACPEMVVIPAGDFLMGSSASEEGRQDTESPQHRVTVRSFALGVTEVTFDEWDACVRGGGCDGHRPDDRGWGRGSRPVILVSWEDARAYVSWLSAETGAAYRLPSESEWEYAARAGTTTPFHTGATISTDQANYDGDDVYRGRTTPVGTFAPNAFGLYDVHGNVLEWMEDCWHDSYRGAPSDGTAWTIGGDCGRRVLRGGSWILNPWFLRSAARHGDTTGDRAFDAGFRVARTLD